MSFWSLFIKDTSLQDALVRSYEGQIGFLRSQLEYEQSKNDEFLKLIHTQAGLIRERAEARESIDFQPIQTGRKSWSETQRELESKYATPKDKVEEHLSYIAANESIIAGDYVPSPEPS